MQNNSPAQSSDRDKANLLKKLAEIVRKTTGNSGKTNDSKNEQGGRR